jgi:mRNA interferase RelE/StbE
VVRRIEALAAQPRPPGCEKLSGSRDHYRVRQGRYRVLYEVDDAGRLVTVVEIGDRKDVDRRA